MTIRKPQGQSLRRILLDMQVPDTDATFLNDYDVRESIDAVRQANADAVMIYFQSHTGLCNWPTESGKQHASFRGRDPVAEAVDYAATLGLPLCAYYSINFNNQAWLDHPDWRFKPAAEGMIGGGLLVRERYGICCLNSPGYRRFIEEQISEILERYTVETLFYDMVWWMGVCLCDHCHARLNEEESIEIPETIDWFDPNWCRFQAARERWLTDFAHWLRGLAKQKQMDISVYHNFALSMMNWTRGVSFESAQAHDFLGGDFYGGRDEQLLISRLMLNLSEHHPVEFMTAVTTNLAEHETLKSPELLAQQSLAAAANGSAMLMIAGMDPDGSINPAVLDHIGHAFRARSPFDAELGGDAVEQIGVYFSDHSKMSFAENGEPLATSQKRGPLDYPHFAAVRGACRKLQQAHLPFGVITKKQLANLHDYDVVVLPNVLRITNEETIAFREYVRAGGKLYASRLTSLTGTDGERHEDFLLNDLFGCHFEREENGRMIYLEPEVNLVRDACVPQRYLRQSLAADGINGVVRLGTTDDHAEVLATINTPFGHPSSGSIEGRDWASIHSSPPHTSTGVPAIVKNCLGQGQVIYSAADLEADDGDAHSRVFLALIRDLLPERPKFEADARESFWLTVFDQPERQRLVVCFLNYSNDLPVRSGKAALRVSAPSGSRFSSLVTLPDQRAAEFEIDNNADLIARLEWSGLFAMYAACYEDSV